MKMRTNIGTGFTLIEILLVILIIGMLAGVFIVAVMPARESTRIKTTALLVETTVPSALDRYNMDIGHYPTEEEGGLDALRKKPSDEEIAKKWAGPYLKKEAKDAWDKALHYEVVEESTGETAGLKYKLWSEGPDEQNETDDDIKSWSEETES